jgi:hypothetical protein
MPLKLSLKPGERFVLNGAVVENGDRRATLILQNKASVLREKDIMQEHEADTPAKRIYFPVMMMYLSSSLGRRAVRRLCHAHDRVHERHSKPRRARRMRFGQPGGDGRGVLQGAPALPQTHRL